MSNPEPEAPESPLFDPSASRAPDHDLRVTLQKGLYWLSGGMALLYLVVSLFVAYVWIDAQNNKHIAANTNFALCQFRADLQTRVNESVIYLTQHPNGIPSLGITKGVILNTIDSQEKTIASLKVLKCS